ncbi:MAG: TlyA family RNA methyltransferase [Lachnospiraceae bacterium]|nr:TlyA family RNA methyltransferase [Lachnospiraceae bacterium]
MKERLDVFLTKQGLFDSREKARNRILSGEVTVNGTPVTKPGTMVSETDGITITGEGMRYVSRAGDKLKKVLDTFGVGLTGLTCIDAGASTGGFTDCMLQSGAAKVFAIDVGTDQLHESLRRNPKVVSMEQTDIRDVTPGLLGTEADFLAADVSFVSLTKVLPAMVGLVKDGGRIACLIKPQFEAGREWIGKNGIVKDKKVHKNVIQNVLTFAEGLGIRIEGLTWSPIQGGSGNTEYLFLGTKGGDGTGAGFRADAERIVNEAFLYYRK